MAVITWSGISYPFRIVNGGVATSESRLVSKDGTSPHLSESIRQICTTLVSERLVNKELGIRIRPYQFATFSREFDAYIDYEVREAIEAFDPRVKVTRLEVNRDKYRGLIVLSVHWRLNEEIIGSSDEDGYRTDVLFNEEGGNG